MKIKVFKVRISDEFLKIDEDLVNEFLDQYDIVNMNAKFVNDENNFWSIMIYYNTKIGTHKPSQKFADSEPELSKDEKIIFEALKLWRFNKSREMSIPAFYVCHNTHLMSIAKLKPVLLKDFSEIKGFGETRTEKYGEEILDVLMNV